MDTFKPLYFLNKGILIIILLIHSFILKAQIKLPKTDLDIEIDTKEWYEEWWVWVIAALILIILFMVISKKKPNH